MELTPERLAAQLGDAPLQPAYLIAGNETLRVLEAADAIRAHARKQGISEREVFEADARGFDWSELSASLNAPGLFSAQRLVEVRLPGGKPGKAGEKALLEACDSVPTDGRPHDVVLLVTCSEWSKQHGGKWSEAIGRIGQIAIAWPIRVDELPRWIEQRLRSRGLSADRDAVQVLAERVEGNLLAAAQEIDKLALLGHEGTLDVASMESLVADASRYDVFRLLDAAMNGQGAQAARMLAGLRAEGAAVPALLGMVTMELQRAATLAQVQARGGNLGAEFKAQRIWDSKQAAYRRALARHDARRWERFVAVVGRIDRTAKGRGEGDAWQQLERLLLAVADAKATRLLQA